MSSSVSSQLALLKSSVQTLWESKPYQEYLKVMARFPTYSVRNTILIYAQKQKATFVAGYQTWQRLFSRHVKKGERDIRILAPIRINMKPKTSQVKQKRFKRSLFAPSMSLMFRKPKERNYPNGLPHNF